MFRNRVTVSCVMAFPVLCFSISVRAAAAGACQIAQPREETKVQPGQHLNNTNSSKRLRGKPASFVYSRTWPMATSAPAL